MAHDHDHNHDHSHSGHSHGGHTHEVKSFNRAFAIAVILTLSYTLIEAGYAVYANALSLLADAVHNLGDVLGLLLAWLANWLLTRPASKRYSYGYKRTTIIAALTNAFILIGTSAIIGFEAIYKLFHLTTVNEPVIMIVGVIGIAVNIGASLLFMRGAHDDLNIKGAFLHLVGDALILLGVVISALIIRYTQWLWLDPVVGLIIVVIILYGTSGLLRDSLALILDAVPRYIDHHGVREFLQQYPGVKTIHDLHIWGLSTREVALTAHLIMPTQRLSDDDYAKINAVLLEKFRIHHVTIQVESGANEDPCGQKIVC